MVSAFSIGTSKRGDLGNGQSRGVPGPGSYVWDKKQKKVPPSWKIGSEQRQAFKSNNAPGPGSYQIKNTVGKAQKYSIALRNPMKGDTEKVPGPGSYNPNQRYDSKKHNQPQFSMGVRTGGVYQSTAVKNPGPGSYGTKSTVMNRPSTKIGTSRRPNLYTSEKTPGPGSYARERPSSAVTKYADSRYKDGPMFGFGTQTRDAFGNSNKAPGPGSYNLKSSINQDVGVTMISRRSQQDLVNAAKIPGPGAYNPNKQQKKNPPAFKIGTENRSNIYDTKNTPGPGTYQSSLYTRPKSPHYKIGTDVRRPLSGASFTPGVGTYNPNNRTTGPKFSIKGASALDPKELEAQRVPGPGSYKPSVTQTKFRPQSAKIGTGQRPSLYQNTTTPGPGIYKVNAARDGPRWGIGTSNRAQFKDNRVPGVGSYNLKSTFADVPHYLIPNTSRQ